MLTAGRGGGRQWQATAAMGALVVLCVLAVMMQEGGLLGPATGWSAPRAPPLTSARPLFPIPLADRELSFTRVHRYSFHVGNRLSGRTGAFRL